MDEILKNLALDAWYKVLIYVGGIFFGIGLLKDIHVITNGQLMLLGSGLFFIGVGEWKNRKVISQFKEANAYTGPAGILSAEIRHPDVVGLLLDIVGVVLIILSLLQIVQPHFETYFDQYTSSEATEESTEEIAAESSVETQSNQSPKPTQ